MLAWAHHPIGIWRRIRTWEGAAMIASVTGISTIAFSTEEPIRYVVFPALIWAALRFGPPGATLAIAITASVAIGETANDVGPFAEQPIDHRTLSTQLYIWVAALTTLFVSAVVSERERSSRALMKHEPRASGRWRNGAGSLEISTIRYLRHCSPAPAHTCRRRRLWSRRKRFLRARRTILGRDRRPDQERAEGDTRAHTHAAPRPGRWRVGRGAHRHAGQCDATGVAIDVRGPGPRLPLSERVEAQLFAIGREALANAQKHAKASAVHVRVEAQQGRVVLEVRDNGLGFDPAAGHPGHFGLDSMHSRAAEVGGWLTVTSAPEAGTAVRVGVPAQPDRA